MERLRHNLFQSHPEMELRNNFFDNFIQSHFLAGEDFDRDLLLPNIDFGTYVRFISFIS